MVTKERVAYLLGRVTVSDPLPGSLLYELGQVAQSYLELEAAADNFLQEFYRLQNPKYVEDNFHRDDLYDAEEAAEERLNSLLYGDLP